MKTPECSFYEWQQRCETEERCRKHLASLRWPKGVPCPHFEQDRSQLLHATKLPLVK